MRTIALDKARRHSHYIRQWRLFREITQSALAKRLGTTKASISRIELGQQPYTQDSLEGIASILNCSVADLLNRHPAHEEEWSLFDLPPEDQEAVQKFIKGLQILRAAEAVSSPPPRPKTPPKKPKR